MGITGSFEGYTSSPLYLFNNGTWSNLQTTGIYSGEKQAITGGALCIGYATTFSSNRRMLLAARLNQTFNLTPYSYLKITFDATSHAQDVGGASPDSVVVGISNTAFTTSFCVTTTSTYEYPDGTIAKAEGARGNTITLNIASISGNHYIYFASLKNGKIPAYVGVTQIYLTTV